ncbi:unnamed protein product [Closterium sp. NIES-54]
MARPVRDLPAPSSSALLSLTWLLLLQPSRPSRAPPAVRTPCCPARPYVLPAAARAAALTRVHTRPLRAADAAALLLAAPAAECAAAASVPAAPPELLLLSGAAAVTSAASTAACTAAATIAKRVRIKNGK